MAAKDTYLGFGVVLSVGMSVLLNYLTVVDSWDVIYPAQQESFETSLSKARAASFTPST